MVLPYKGQATVDPDNPGAWGRCYRCYDRLNHVDLHWQMRYAGATLVNTGKLVCARCLDIPNPQEKVILLPPDPVPIRNARPSSWTLDESSAWTLRAVVPGAKMFQVAAKITVVLTQV